MQKQVESDVQEIINGVGVENLKVFAGREVFISGACGFLGSWFIAVFQELNKNYFDKKSPVKVYAMDSFIAADETNTIIKVDDPNISFMKDDISTHHPQGSVDYIIHAAGIASPIYYRKYPLQTIDGMVLGLRNLLEFAKESPVKSFLNFSSSEMYGNPTPDQVPTKETYNGNVSPIGPRSCYDESKRMGETMCMCYESVHGIPVKWVRPFNVYGPGMRIADDRVVPKFIFQILRGMDLTVHVPGVQTRTFCYITDAMIGFFKTLLSDQQGEVYNIGRSDPEISIVNLAEMMFEMFKPEKSKLNQVPMPEEYPTDQAQRRCPDISKARAQLGYEPKISLAEGLQRSYEWCKWKLEKQTKIDELKREVEAYE